MKTGAAGKTREEFRAEFFLVMATVIWGGSFVVIKTGLQDISPLLFIGIRFLAAALLMLPVVLFRHPRITRQTIRFGIILGIFQFGGYAFQTIGLQFTTVAKSSLLTYLYALLTPPLEFIILKKRVRPATLIGIGIVFVGIYLFSAPSGGSLNKGDFFSVLSAVSYSFYIIFLDKLTRTEDPTVLSLIQFVMTAVMGFALAPFLETTRCLFTRGSLIAIGYLATRGSVGAIYIMNRFQKDTSPSKAVIIYSLEPVFAILFGFFLIGESLTRPELIGALCIFFGVLFSELAGFRKGPPVTRGSQEPPGSRELPEPPKGPPEPTQTPSTDSPARPLREEHGPEKKPPASRKL